MVRKIGYALCLVLFASFVWAADITVTATSVKVSTGAVVDKTKNAGATVTAGQVVYLDESTDTWKLADCDDTAATAAAKGIALHGAASGQPLSVQTSGDITIGATVAVGTFYVVSKNAGGIAPYSDLAQNQYVTVIGYAKTTGVLTLGFVNTAVKVP